MAFLQGISPWWWVALAILLAAAEMLTVSTVLIWSALAAMLTALCLWIFPDLGGPAQIAIFALGSIALVFPGRRLAERLGARGGRADNPQLNRRADRLVGREAVVVTFEFHEGQVSIDGVPWPARLDGSARTPVPGDRVRVTAADGIVVWVRPIPPEAPPAPA